MSNKNKCPLCGTAVLYQGLTNVECGGLLCKNNPQPHTYIVGGWRWELRTLSDGTKMPVPLEQI